MCFDVLKIGFNRKIGAQQKPLLWIRNKKKFPPVKMIKILTSLQIHWMHTLGINVHKRAMTEKNR